MKIDVMEYFRTEYRTNSILGTSRYAPLILIINDKEKIVKELLEDSDCYYKENLLLFLDRALYDCMRATQYNEKIYEDIRWVLKSYNDIKKIKNNDEITLEEFDNYLKNN